MEDALKQDPNMMLFDVGCNIGVYTVWAAAMDKQVVCVEMVLANVLRVQMALALSNLSSHVTIVNNALYSDHRELEIKFYKNSNGQSRLNSSKVYTPEQWDNSRAGFKVKTICIDDLTPLMSGKPVFIKMDIENTEQFALMCAHRFFKAVDVRIVQMEWVVHVDAESAPILDFMRVHGYASSSSSKSYRPLSLAQYSGDVYFLKKSFFNI
ncbi:uncharacterized protein LOC131948995 [Physella acuta]|uniref:uncharacterized protein LOC131948995 n=1 Tax=Physella acuta TaxID=109671 RepID=UPI0027DB61F1|nr:uncharacterized protein LOC131948995 [Physella acuta]